MSIPALEDQFPDFYRSTDQTSLDGQRLFVRLVRVQLIALVGAAFVGAFTWQVHQDSTDWAGVLAVVAFVVALFVRGYLWRARPERDWYAGRAGAESAKTLAWRFCVGAEPFGIAMSDAQASDLLLVRLGDVRRGLKGVVILPPTEAKGEITPAMLDARHSNLADRKAVYLQDRIGAQRDWYARKARSNLKFSRLWMAAMLALEAAGVVGGVLKATGVVNVDLLGLVGAVVAAVVAWSEMRQYSMLSSAYSVAAQELSDIATRGARPMTEDEWADFAANAEEAISREHTMWAASRDV
ncbi:DUF4231 domain-containing protein [Microbacterium aurum]